MSNLTTDEIRELLQPYLTEEVAWGGERPELLDRLSTYLDLLVKWNGRMNLTAVRDPREMVKRHFGESLFAACHVSGTGTLLDLGSGAGFPGLPIQLWHPQLKVTLAESQLKKSTFLREAVRSLSLSTEVFAGKVEEMTPGRCFDAVVLRSVDRTRDALESALQLSVGDVWLLGSSATGAMGMGRARMVEEFTLPGGSLTSLFRMMRDSSTWNKVEDAGE